MATIWQYAHQDLGEPPFVDGSAVLRPVVPLLLAEDLPAVFGVLDSGSPVSIASADVFRWLGVDVGIEPPLFELPLSVGGGFDRIPVYRVALRLRAPGSSQFVEWSLDLGARRRWRLPFAVLLGQRGWFDTFPTRLDVTTSSVELPDDAW